jgi:hypothetical protein
MNEMTDQEIEQTAIRMCQHLGLDPHQDIKLGADEWKTPAELVGSGMASFDMSWTVPRWKSYRHAAAMAIAAHRAVSEGASE